MIHRRIGRKASPPRRRRRYKSTKKLTKASPCPPCSPFRFWWEDQDNGCPTLVLEREKEFAVAVWNAAIKAAAKHEGEIEELLEP